MGAAHINRPTTIVLLRNVGSAGLLFMARATAVIYQLRFANHTFGVSYGGLSALLNQVTFYILLAELGLAAATTSLLFEPAHTGDVGRVKALVCALQVDVRRIIFYLAPLASLASLVLAFSLRKQVPFHTLLIAVLLTCASAFLTFMALPYQSHFNATDRVPERNFILGCGFILKVTLGILLARLMHSFIGLPLGTAIVGVGELYVQRHLVLPLLAGADATEEMVAGARQSIRERAKFVLAHRIGYLFIYQSDYIILLLASSLSLLSYFAQYQYIYAGLLSFSIAVGGTFTAKLAKRQIHLGRASFLGFYRKTSMLTAVVAFVCGGGFYLGADFAIQLLYKSTAYDHKAVALFSVLLMLNIFKMNDDLWVETTGAFNKGYYLPILEATSYVLLGLALVRHLHIVGILYAGIAINLLFSVFLRSFVIGSGVMDRAILPTFVVKITNLLGVAAASYLLMTLLRMFPYFGLRGATGHPL